MLITSMFIDNHFIIPIKKKFKDNNFIKLLFSPTEWLMESGSKLGNLEKGLNQDKAAPLLDRLIFDKVSHISFPIITLEDLIYILIMC